MRYQCNAHKKKEWSVDKEWHASFVEIGGSVHASDLVFVGGIYRAQGYMLTACVVVLCILQCYPL